MSNLVNGSELARLFDRSKAAVSQWTSSGKLAGCFTGEGRDRLYDVAKCAEALGIRMDAGQRLGNAAGTEQARLRLTQETPDRAPETPAQPRTFDGELAKGDEDRYRLARILKAEEEARRARRQNAEEEGRFVLRTAMEREISRVLSEEMSAIDALLTAASRTVADEIGADAKVVRRILREAWRAHRAQRSQALASAPSALAEDEAEANF